MKDASALGLHPPIWLQDLSEVVFLWLQGEQSLLFRHVLNCWQTEVRQVLMRLAKILAHRVNKHFVFAFQVGKGALEFDLEIAQMIWYLT